MYFIQIGKIEIPEFITTTDVYESAEYTWVEVPECDDSKEIHIYSL